MMHWKHGKHCKPLFLLAPLLVIIGGLNWGIVGLFGFSLVDVLFGRGSKLSRIVYTMVGVSSVVMMIIFAKKHKKYHEMKKHWM